MNRYSVNAVFSMAAEQDVEVEDELARSEYGLSWPGFVNETRVVVLTVNAITAAAVAVATSTVSTASIAPSKLKNVCGI